MTIQLNVVVAFLFFVVAAFAIDRDVCASSMRELNGTFLDGIKPDDSNFFYHNASSDVTIPLSVRMQTCLNKCGHGFTWYSGDEISSRFVGWLIPVLVLIGNMHMPPLNGIYKAFSILHFIGDPIDSMLSLQHTLGVRHAAQILARQTVTEHGLIGRVQPKDLAAVFWALDSLNTGSSKSPIDILEPVLHLPEFPFAISEAAADIRHTTVHESTRTYLAIITYLTTVTTAFVRASSNGPKCLSRPGNRVALAMLYCWLLPAILLSTFAGRFTTSEASVRAFRRFIRHLKHPELTETSILPARSQSHNFTYRAEDDFQDTSAYSGSIYTYRPCKPLVTRSFPYYAYPGIMLILAVLPILIAMCVAIAISYHTPTVGFSCRSITEISIGVIWLLSFGITLLIQKLCITTGKFQILLVGIKDFFLGGGALLTIALIYAGAFNSCWCWSNGLNGILGNSLHVLLGVDASLQTNAERVYPVLVGGGLGAQVAVFFVMWRVVWGEKSWWARGVRRAKKDHRPDHTRAGSGSDMPLVERIVVTGKNRS